MSSVFITPPQSAYTLLKAFQMPTDHGTIWAIAFSDKDGRFITSSLSVCLTLMFAWAWSLVAAATIYFVPDHFPRRRLVALVALRNTSNAWSAVRAFFFYTTESMGCWKPRKTGQGGTWRDSLFGMLFFIFALVVVVASTIMGVVIPPLLQVSSFAPVKATALYYPDLFRLKSESTYRALITPFGMRAVSIVDILGDTIQSRVTVERDISVQTVNESEPMYGLKYGYNITGVQFGLKHAPDLILSVTGACRTEYGWLNHTRSNATQDSYDLFGDSSNTFNAALEGELLKYPPKPGFIVPRTVTSQRERGNISYAIATTLARRGSFTPGMDPWYLTEAVRPTTGANVTNRIKAGRPVLSCWEADVWTHRGKSVAGVKQLNASSEFPIPQVLRNLLYLALEYPAVKGVGQDAVMSALASVALTADSIRGTLDAQRSSIERDMKRLVAAAYVKTLNVLAQTTVFQGIPENSTVSNAFYSETGPHELLDGADDFVIPTPDVITFELVGLVTAASLIVFLLILKLVLTVKLFYHTDSSYAHLPDNSDRDPYQQVPVFNKDRWARFRAFSAVHLLRNAYEDGTGHPEHDWQCCDDLPEPTDKKPLRLVRCGRRDGQCAGHLATDGAILGVHSRKRSTTTSMTNISPGVITSGGYTDTPGPTPPVSYTNKINKGNHSRRSSYFQVQYGEAPQGQAGSPYFQQQTPPLTEGPLSPPLQQPLMSPHYEEEILPGSNSAPLLQGGYYPPR